VHVERRAAEPADLDLGLVPPEGRSEE